jgi:DNA adenine methylase
MKDSEVRYKSPLRYPGGKSGLCNFVKAIFRVNDLAGGVYAEPYAGGASVALALLYEEYVSRVYINDADPAVHAFWQAALNHTDALCRRIRDTRPTIAEWERQRAIYARGSSVSPVSLGFAAFFLNRTNRSGIIASAGMIGGRTQHGRWRINARYNGKELATRIERIGTYRGRVIVSGDDAAVFLTRVAAKLPSKSLIYLDPPYYVKGERRLYANYYEAKDHAAIAKSIFKMPKNWIVSYDNVSQIRALYGAYRSLSYSLRYSASTAKAGEESMFFSDSLNIPTNCRPAAAAYRRGALTRAVA